jgi:hypothetical protein
MVMGGIVPVVNVPGVTPGHLVLDGPTLAKIFLGDIKAWNDPAIAKLNPSVKLPAQPILVVHRSDGSGTTFNFTNYLDKVSGNRKLGPPPRSNGQWDPTAAAAALKFFARTYVHGAKMAEELDYVPMPASVVTSIEKVWSDEIKDAKCKTAFHRNALNIQSGGGRNAPSPYAVLMQGITPFPSVGVTASTLLWQSALAPFRACARYHSSCVKLRLRFNLPQPGVSIIRAAPHTSMRFNL